MTCTRPAYSGLTSAEAAHRLQIYGPNVVTAAPHMSWAARVVRQLRDPLIIILLGAVFLTLLTSDYPDTLIIALVIVINTSVGVIQEVRADRAIAALSALTAPKVRVRRDDAVVLIESTEVVPGDVVVLGEGDIVPADAQVCEAAALTVDESALTGESVPVVRTAGAEGRPADQLEAGTVVVRGRGVALVTATGAASAIGRIAALMAAAPPATPLQRRLARLGRTLGLVGGFLCVVVASLGLANGRSVELMVVTAVSLLVAAVPESLPAVVTLALALGAHRMARRHALIRRLPAVETLGSVTVLVTDKTGTLTEGRMTVERLWTPSGEASVTGAGYDPSGHVTADGIPVHADEVPHLRALLEAAVLCNDATLREPTDPDTEWQPVGDPMEAALVAAAARAGISKTATDRRFPRIAEEPFDSSRQLMITIHRRPDDGQRITVCKGAPEAVLPMVDDDPAVVASCLDKAVEYAASGYRVLAFAAGVRAMDPGPAELASPGHEEPKMSLLGLAALLDPPRPSAAQTIEACRAAGIEPILVTGDHPATAAAIARRLKILASEERVASGEDLANGRIEDITAVRVFARTRPEQKVAVVEAWQRAGHSVAVTGDGVNDGPALRRADIGVAMGGRGTEVARQAADLVLADDDLGTVVAAVEEGRRIYDNIRRFLLYGLAGGTAEIAIMLLGPLFGFPLPLLPAQILWVNLVTHGIPGVALGSEPAEPDVLRRPPRSMHTHVLGEGLTTRIAAVAAVVTAAALATGVSARASQGPWQTMMFLSLASTQLAVALGVRARIRGGHRFLFTAVAVAFALQLAGVYVPTLRELLGTQPLDAGEATRVLILAALGGIVARGLNRPVSAPRTEPPGPARDLDDQSERFRRRR